ncbi:MAG: hypothetical protein HFH82_17450 [Lachnospiraceae bacterium]|nr:hypothetical protein [Lachnospiraceae bacterium]
MQTEYVENVMDDGKLEITINAKTVAEWITKIIKDDNLSTDEKLKSIDKFKPIIIVD